MMMSEEIDELSQVLSEHLSVKDEEGHVVLQVAQIATVYFTDPHRPEVRDAVASCCESYSRHCGQHLRWALNPDTERMERFGTGKGKKPRAWLSVKGEDEEFAIIWHGAENDRGASAFHLEAMGSERRPYLDFGYLQVSFPLLWFADGSGSLPEVLLDLCRTLKAASGYGGIGVIEGPASLMNSDFEPIVYRWAQRFPGLEADYPISHSLWLRNGRESGRDGIKGGNWLTALSDRYLPELGGAEKIEADLKALDSGFLVHRYDGGLVIQAGPRPQLGDAERNLWPALYAKLAKYLKPIRVTRHNAFQHGGPGVRFNKERSEAWLRRFDDR
jgi:hypothetical protein